MIKITFFGSSKFSVFCLDEMKRLNLLPSLIVTTPDKQTGRGLKVNPTPVKIWAEENKIPCLSPAKLDSDFMAQLAPHTADVFLVASYGKIVPKAVLDLPKYKTLNIHPSLLPKYRGPSPLQTQILNDDKNVGVTLMLMDEKVDHGPIIAEAALPITDWPRLEVLKELTAKLGVKLFADNLNNWISGKITPVPQDDNDATFTKKVEKVDGLVDMEMDNPYQIFLKIQAYSIWPQAYFFMAKNDKKLRVIIKDAVFQNGVLTITRVLPEGKKEMSYDDFLRGLK